MKPNSNMKNPTQLGAYSSRLIAFLALTAWALIPQLAMAQELSWSSTEGADITGWFNTIIQVIMAVFVMTAIVMGSLAFKQLAADGNWKDFWSKIAGAMGMFVVPIAIYWIKDQ
jgi:hypothetical protein